MTQLLAARGDARLPLPTVADLIAVERPEVPMVCIRPAAVEAAGERFVQAFPGDVLYAVKCNPDPAVLRALWRGGVRHFDCASAAEVALVRGLFPEAGIHFMHPVKPRGAIRSAWFVHGVRDFAFDSAEEMAKILQETGGGSDLGLVLRLAVPKGEGAYDLSGKFGAAEEEAVTLLRAARPHAARLGRHLPCRQPVPGPAGLAPRRRVGGPRRARGRRGGGGARCRRWLPGRIPGMVPPPLGAFLAEIEDAVEEAGLDHAMLWAEPGRALVADGTSVVVQVQARRGDALYVNDGVYGALSDAAARSGLRFPARAIRPEGAVADTEQAYRLFGPTCDSADVMPGPWILPADMAEGDWIEIGQTGAYGTCLRTPFNGFDAARQVVVRDAPMICGT